MEITFRLESYDLARVGLHDFLAGLPEFIREENGSYLLGPELDAECSVGFNEDSVVIRYFAITRGNDSVIGAVIRHVLSLNDHVVVSGI